MAEATWNVRAYLSYEIEAEDEEEAIFRLGECLLSDLRETGDIRELGEVAAVKISDKGIEG